MLSQEQTRIMMPRRAGLTLRWVKQAACSRLRHKMDIPRTPLRVRLLAANRHRPIAKQPRFM